MYNDLLALLMIVLGAEMVAGARTAGIRFWRGIFLASIGYFILIMAASLYK